ncbi:hypothetical protein YC2023_060249 [Brassica napus]
MSYITHNPNIRVQEHTLTYITETTGEERRDRPIKNLQTYVEEGARRMRDTMIYVSN